MSVHSIWRPASGKEKLNDHSFAWGLWPVTRAIRHASLALPARGRALGIAVRNLSASLTHGHQLPALEVAPLTKGVLGQWVRDGRRALARWLLC
jgi:hypothetical protein